MVKNSRDQSAPVYFMISDGLTVAGAQGVAQHVFWTLPVAVTGHVPVISSRSGTFQTARPRSRVR
jgi:hypothetical protein